MVSAGQYDGAILVLIPGGVAVVVTIATVVVDMRSTFSSENFVPFEQKSKSPSVIIPDLASWSNSVILASLQSIGLGYRELQVKGVCDPKGNT